MNSVIDCATYMTSILLFVSGMGMGDMYGSPNSASSPYSLSRAPVHSNAMLIPGHAHSYMMAAHGGHMTGHMGPPHPQSPPLHSSMDPMTPGHIQDIHAG